MKRCVWLLLVVLALDMGTRAAAAGGQKESPKASPFPSSQVSADDAFAAFVDRYFDGLHHFQPAEATSAGIHQYDAELPAYSRRDFEQEIARSRRALAELLRIPRSALAHDNQFDARLLESSIRSNLHDLEDIREWEKDPNFYNGTISYALFVLVQRDFAPVDERMKSLIAREQRVPEILDNARANVQNPPSIYTTIAIRQVASEISFLQNQLPQAVAEAKDDGLKAQFQQVNARAVAAYEKYLEYLKTDLAPRSHGSFAIGTENYRKKLLYDEMVSTPLDRLLSIGERELRRTQEEFKATAALIDPAKPPAQVIEDLSRDHPDRDHVISASQAVLEGLRNFVTSHNIATIASPQNPRVVETPAFMRVLTFASMDTPGPFETASTQAFYNVTLPDPDWSPDRQEQLLRFFNDYSIRVTSIHEVFPGHYTQFLRLRSAPTKVRKLIGCSSNAEGWAHYSEQMMLEEGYGEGDPKLLLFQLQAALLRLCRYMVGIRMHTGGMSLDEATEFFQREGYLEHDNAEREAMRGTADPTYLVYTLGKLEILKLRGDYKRKIGDSFNLKEFHDRFLGYGYPPVQMIREEMLGNTSPAL
jgi:uncharacterized protein (DUF885 family)